MISAQVSKLFLYGDQLMSKSANQFCISPSTIHYLLSILLFHIKILNGMLNAKLPNNDNRRNPNHPGDLKLNTEIKMQNNTSSIRASMINAIEIILVNAEAICPGINKSAYINNPFTPINPNTAKHHKIIFWVSERLINSLTDISLPHYL